jgi:hypothetical protein
MVIADCNNKPTVQYCRWATGCYPIANPNEPSADNPNMTELQACDAFGFVSNLPDCGDYVEPSESWYCYWDNKEGTGCVPIPKPDAENKDNPGMTEKEVCDKYGFLTTSSTCADYVKPSVVYYCEWETGCWQMKPDAPDENNAGMTKLEVCEAYGKVWIAPNQPAKCQ